MPPPQLIEPDCIETGQVVMTREEFYKYLPQEYEFKLLDGVSYMDPEGNRMVAYHDVGPDAWWCKGHVPGKPLLPGVLMLEMAAQTAVVMAKASGKAEGFIAFGGVDECRFREVVSPPSRLYLVTVGREHRSRRVVSDAQGVVDGRLVFEARVTGLVLR